MSHRISLFHLESSMTPNITGGEVVFPLIKLIFLRCSWDLNILLQSIFLTLFVIYITFRHVFIINLTFYLIHEHLINTHYMFLMFYIKYYMEELNTYFKEFKVSIRTFIIITGRDTFFLWFEHGDEISMLKKKINK